MLKINGVDIPTPSAMQVGIHDISNAERNAKGNMMIDRIATKRKIELGWGPLSPLEMSVILNAVKDVFFSVTYPEPMTGDMQTKTFYVGDRTTPMLIFQDGQPTWENLKMNFVER